MQLMRKHGKGSNIFIDQRYGPDTTWRQNKALEARKELKMKGEIVAGFVRYPAKLMVKYDAREKKYTLYDDYSKLVVPPPQPRR